MEHRGIHEIMAMEITPSRGTPSEVEYRRCLAKYGGLEDILRHGTPAEITECDLEYEHLLEYGTHAQIQDYEEANREYLLECAYERERWLGKNNSESSSEDSSEEEIRIRRVPFQDMPAMPAGFKYEYLQKMKTLVFNEI